MRLTKKIEDGQYLNLRTIEIKLNDCYSIKMDCDTGEYIE